MKRFPRRQLLLGLSALLLTCHLPAHADEPMDAIHKRGRLRGAVYNDFPPYSDAGKGVDVELGRALAAKLGLQAEIIGFMAGEDMGDDNKKANPEGLAFLLVLAPRPGLEPGTYGLTVRRSVAVDGRLGLDFQGLGGAARYDAVDFA